MRRVIAWGIAALALAGSVASLLYSDPRPFDVLTIIAIPLAFGGVGAFLTVRVPENRIGPLLLVATIGFTTLLLSGTWLYAFGYATPDAPLSVIAGLLSNLVFIPSLVLILVGVPLLFPDGRLLSPRWRWVAVGAAIAVGMAEIRILFGMPQVIDVVGGENPLFQPDVVPILDAMDRIASFLAVPIFALALASLVVRYRRSDDTGRAQIRWLGAATSVALVAFSVTFFLPEDTASTFEDLGIVALNLIPVAIGIAIVRYRLYEIDRLISRSITYALITVILVATYAGVVLVLQGPLGGVIGNDTVVVALSTLVVASLFQPLRRRIQQGVDRPFDRARVDADRTAGAFGTRLRDEVDIDTVLADLSSTVDGALRPTRLELWLRDPGR